MEAEAADLALQVPATLTVQLKSLMRDMEATMYCTAFLPSENEIAKEMQGAGRFYNDMVTNQPTKERRSPLILFFSAMLKAILEKVAREDQRRGDILRSRRVDQIVQTSPDVRQAWDGTQNTDHLRDGRVHHVPMEAT